MERTKKTSTVKYSVQDEPIVLSKITMDILLDDRIGKSADLISLYCFYYYTAKWQKTNQPKASKTFVMQRLGWTADRVRKTKNRLKELKLIKDVTHRNPETNRIESHYIHLNFIWAKNPTGYGLLSDGISHREGNQTTNAYKKTNNKNNNNNNNKEVQKGSDFPIVPNLFEKFWNLYPRKVNKGNAIVAWSKLCKKSPKDRPTWKTIRRALKGQKESKQWLYSIEQICYPSTWLNGIKWLNDPSTMLPYIEKSFNKWKEKESTFGSRRTGKSNMKYINHDYKL